MVLYVLLIITESAFLLEDALWKFTRWTLTVVSEVEQRYHSRNMFYDQGQGKSRESGHTVNMMCRDMQ